MENFKAIDFHQSRDFSRKMNATFEFIRQNFKALGKSILLIAGPPVLVASLIISTFMGEFLNLTQAAASNAGDTQVIETYFMSVSFWLQIVLMLCFFLLSGIMTIATINNYILLYEEKQSNRIEVSQVWERVRETFWMYFGTMFFFMLLGIAVYILMIIPVVLVAAISPALIFLGIMLLFCVIFYLMISVSLTFIVRAYEKKSFFDAIARSFRLVQNKWWSTFGLIVVLYMIMIMISYIFIIPWYAVTVVTALHNTSTETFQEPSTLWQIMTVVFFTLYYLAQMIFASLPNVGIAFQYFNLVELKKPEDYLVKLIPSDKPRPHYHRHQRSNINSRGVKSLILIFLLGTSIPAFSQESDSVSAETGLTSTILEGDSEEEGDSRALPDSSTVYTRHAETEKLKTLKSDPALQYKEPPTIAESLWDRFWLWLKQLLGALFEGAVSTNWGRVFMYITGIVLVVALILTILRVNAFKIFYSGEGASTFKYNVLDENIHEMDFEKLIEDALSKKDYRGGVRLVFLYSLKMLSDKNLIHWDQGKTNHDYLDELKQDELRGGFNDLNLYFEYAWYGNFTINAETFAHVQQIFNVWKANLR